MKLETEKGSQTETVPCGNIIFIMTTNAADALIEKQAMTNDVYTVTPEEMGDLQDRLQIERRSSLERTYAY